MRLREGGVSTTGTYRYDGGKTVSVRKYLRHRYGKWEQVRSHFRNPPRR